MTQSGSRESEKEDEKSVNSEHYRDLVNFKKKKRWLILSIIEIYKFPLSSAIVQITKHEIIFQIYISSAPFLIHSSLAQNS